MTTTPIAEEFEAHRPRLFGLAYRMLGSAEEAEDTVQERSCVSTARTARTSSIRRPGWPERSPTSASTG
ncbi:sigma factor [Streptomyces sp. NPDC050625]|uniref:sigma factor n=1 Tax=Streptomyces sp. NPDC050625 TaxID=3154629 RepID=UPI0034297405